VKAIQFRFLRRFSARPWAGGFFGGARALGLRSATVLVLTLLAACSSAPPADTGGGGGGRKGGKGKNADGGPVPVVTAVATSKSVPIEIPVVGNVEAFSLVSIKPQVSGQLMNVYVTDGDYVKKGDKLFTIDPRTFESQLAQAQANMARSSALLAQAEANLQRDIAQERYQRDLAVRYKKLADEGVMSKDQSDSQKTNADVLAQGLEADKAAIASAKAQIEADKANADNLRLTLSYTSITSPIDGRTGNVAVKQGNIVTQNSTELMQILQTEPIYVTFAVPEARLADVKKYMGAGTLPVMAKPQDGSGESETGDLSFIDNSVDSTTGTIKLKGTFKNSARKLWPGQFVNVVLRLTTRGNAVVVPNQAVQTGQDGTFIYVVKEDRTVEVRPVITGPRVDLDLVIDKGLAAGETVVTEGQLRLQPGSRIQTKDGRSGGGRGRDGGDGGGFKDKGDKGGFNDKGDKGKGDGKSRGEFKSSEIKSGQARIEFKPTPFS
jgi:multidrug efflux system membrane fusion protein